MENRPSITRNSHSIANISDAIRNHIRRDSLGGHTRHHRGQNSGKSDFPVNNEDFENISNAVVHLFQLKKLQENELASLQENVRNLITTDAGPLIYDYYKDKLMKKGMIILREKIKNETGLELLSKLGEMWDYFYQEILTSLQALLFPIKTKQSLSIRHVTLIEFRNIILLKLPVAEALEELTPENGAFPSVQQMFLVLQGVNETPCTENCIQLERIIVKVIHPYLGRLGVYNGGGSEPEIRSNFRLPTGVAYLKEPRQSNQYDSTECSSQSDSRMRRHGLSPLVWTNKSAGNKRGSGNQHHSLLQVVQEQDRGQIRRYSIATT